MTLIRDDYTFDFLELGEEHGERELERALIARIEDFLRAMGGLFAFMGSQFRLENSETDLAVCGKRLRSRIAIL